MAPARVFRSVIGGEGNRIAVRGRDASNPSPRPNRESPGLPRPWEGWAIATWRQMENVHGQMLFTAHLVWPHDKAAAGSRIFSVLQVGQWGCGGTHQDPPQERALVCHVQEGVPAVNNIERALWERPSGCVTNFKLHLKNRSTQEMLV